MLFFTVLLVATSPNISQVLSCGSAPPAPVAVNELQRVEIDTAVFPDALCNDGSRAAIYFRPYRGAANRNKWVIQLKGGGGCTDGDSCAARWCACTDSTACPGASADDYTGFTMENMQGNGPSARRASGIMLRQFNRPNPLADYNQVRFEYCSSDYWTGTRRDVDLVGRDPITGAAQGFSMHFLGARILDADMDTLRRNGVAALTYTLGALPVPMPDLDAATEVVFAGDSAGGAGIAHNLDRLRGMVPANALVEGLVDAMVGPEMSNLSFATSSLAPTITTYPAFAAALAAGQGVTHGARLDQSCIDWHQANDPGSEGECNDTSHVIRHHLATPFFARVALHDVLISQLYIDLSADPASGNMTRSRFADTLRTELADLAGITEEMNLISRAPGVFAPTCAKHDTIGTNADTFDTTVTVNGSLKTLFDAFNSWRVAGADQRIISTGVADSSCP